jgi:hypothetical protein
VAWDVTVHNNGVIDNLNSQPIVLPAFTPTANSTLFLHAHCGGARAATPSHTFGDVGTFSSYEIQGSGGEVSQSFHWAKVGAAPTSGVPTITFNSVVRAKLLSAFCIHGDINLNDPVHATNRFKNDGGSGSNHTVTLPSMPPEGNVILASMGGKRMNGPNADNNYNQITLISMGNGINDHTQQAQWDIAEPLDLDADWVAMGGQANSQAALIMELKAAAPPGPPAGLRTLALTGCGI